MTLLTAHQRLAPLPEPRRMALLRLIHAEGQRATVPNGTLLNLAPIAHRILDEHHVPGAWSL